MSNKDTVLTKLSHEDNAKSVHEDTKKSLADHGSYDPTLRILNEIKEVPALDNMEQEPPISVVTPGYPQVVIKSAVPAKVAGPGPNPTNPAKTAAGVSGVAKGHV